MLTYVACKSTNEYCESVDKMTSKNIRRDIQVKNHHDMFSKIHYTEIIDMYAETELLFKIKEYILHQCVKYSRPTYIDKLVAQALRFNLRGLNDKQTMIKFDQLFQNHMSFIERYQRRG